MNKTPISIECFASEHQNRVTWRKDNEIELQQMALSEEAEPDGRTPSINANRNVYLWLDVRVQGDTDSVILHYNAGGKSCISKNTPVNTQ